MRKISPWAPPLFAEVPSGVARQAALRISREGAFTEDRLRTEDQGPRTDPAPRSSVDWLARFAFFDFARHVGERAVCLVFGAVHLHDVLDEFDQLLHLEAEVGPLDFQVFD